MADVSTSSHNRSSHEESASFLPSIHEAQSLDYSMDEESTATGRNLNKIITPFEQTQDDDDRKTVTSTNLTRPLLHPNREQDEDPNTRAERLNALRQRSVSDKSLMGSPVMHAPPPATIISDSPDEQPSNSLPSKAPALQVAAQSNNRSLSMSTEGTTETAPSVTEAQSPSPSTIHANNSDQSHLVSPPLRDIFRKTPSGSSRGSNESTPSVTPVSSLQNVSTGLSRRRNATVASPDRNQLLNKDNNTFQHSLYSSPPPSSKRQGLSDASRMFDRDGKGYLDSTERALRSMDTDNDGQLSIHQIYFLMKSLQQSQETSNDLVFSLRKEQRKAETMKWGIIFLAVLAVLLSMANIGTAFAAANLAKDTSIQSNTGDLVDKSSKQRVGVSSKIKEIQMKPIQESQRRELAQLLQQRRRRALLERNREMESVIGYGNETYENENLWGDNETDTIDEFLDGDNSTEGTTTITAPTTTVNDDFLCEENYSYYANGEEVVNRVCESDAILDFQDAVDIYRSFCPTWQSTGNVQSPCESQDGGVDHLFVTCNGKVNRLYGDPFPRGGPFVFDTSEGTTHMFPGTKVNGGISWYYGEQYLYDLSVPSICTQQFALGVVCPPDWDHCWTIGHFAGPRCPIYEPGLNANVKFSLCDPF